MSSWIRDGFVDEEFDCHEVCCFGSNVSCVVDEVSADRHSHLIWICLLFSEGGDNADICGFGARW